MTIETKYFGDLEAKLEEAVQVVTQHNRYVAFILEKAGQMIPRSNLDDVKKSIVKKHRKFYGMISKYDSNGELQNV